MLALSAPSANTGIRISDTDFIGRLLAAFADNPVSGFPQRLHGRIGSMCRRPLAVAVIDQNGFTPRVITGIHVAPAIADKKTARQVYMMLALRFEQQAGPGFAALAVIVIVMITDEDVIDGQ